MLKIFLMLMFVFCSITESGLLTPFEMSGGTQTATYDQCISFYNDLDEQSDEIKMISLGENGIGKPLNLVIIDKDKLFTPEAAHKQNQSCTVLHLQNQ